MKKYLLITNEFILFFKIFYFVIPVVRFKIIKKVLYVVLLIPSFRNTV